MTEEEPDLLAEHNVPRAHSAAELGDAPASQDEPSVEEPDLASEADLKGLMAHLNPLAVRDITTIEKGVEHFFLFHHAHLALTRPDQLKFLTEKDLNALEERGALRRFATIRFQPGATSPTLVPVLIRPASLKGEQIVKVKQGCVRGSVAALLEAIGQRDERIRELERQNELSRWVSDQLPKVTAEGRSLRPENRADLNILIENLSTLSYEHFLEKEIRPPEQLAVGILRLLSQPGDELRRDLALVPEHSPAALAAVDNRGGRPVLLRLTPDFHLVQPHAGQLMETTSAESRTVNSELEWVLLLFVQLGRRILQNILPEEESGWIQKSGTSQAQRYLEEMRKHPSLTGEEWPAVPKFMEAYEALIKHVRNLEQVRHEFLLAQAVEQTRTSLNMQFEPVAFNAESISLPEAISTKISREEAFAIVLERIKAPGDVFAMDERRSADQSGPPGVYLMHAANLPQAFIRNKKRRSFLHIFARQNGRPNGIYSFLREVNEADFSREIVDEQIALSRAIREWEDDQEKERLKRELASLGIFERIWRFFLGLFGIQADRRAESVSEPKKARSSRKGRKGATGVLVGPREKAAKIPERVQKAVDYVARKNRGIIWLDEVQTALGTARFTSDSLGDMLFYDAQARYEEVRALLQERRVFIERAHLGDVVWIQATLDYLENVARPGPEHGLLARYLEGRSEELLENAD